MGVMPSKIELEIEELVLHGFASRDRHLIAEAIERELSRLLAEQGIPASMTQSHEITRLDGGSFEIEPNSKPEDFGSRVAEKIYGGLNS